MARTTKPEKRKKTIPYNFGDKHKAYIRKSQDCMINVAEGAVRAGKTVDNVLAFCHELKTTKDTSCIGVNTRQCENHSWRL